MSSISWISHSLKKNSVAGDNIKYSNGHTITPKTISEHINVNFNLGIVCLIYFFIIRLQFRFIYKVQPIPIGTYIILDRIYLKGVQLHVPKNTAIPQLLVQRQYL